MAQKHLYTTLGKISAFKGLLPFEEFLSMELTNPLKNSSHYSSSMMNSGHIKKTIKNYQENYQVYKVLKY